MRRVKLEHMPNAKYGWCDGVAVWTTDPFNEEINQTLVWDFFCDCALWESIQEI